MIFNNIYYLEAYPRIKYFIKQIERFADEGNVEFAYINMRRTVDEICLEYMNEFDEKYNKLSMKKKCSYNTGNMISHLYKLKVISKKEKKLYDAIRMIGNQYVHGYRNPLLYVNDRIKLETQGSKLNTYLYKVPIIGKIHYTKEDIKDIRKKVVRKEKLSKMIRRFINILFGKRK